MSLFALVIVSTYLFQDGNVRAPGEKWYDLCKEYECKDNTIKEISNILELCQDIICEEVR